MSLCTLLASLLLLSLPPLECPFPRAVPHCHLPCLVYHVRLCSDVTSFRRAFHSPPRASCVPRVGSRRGGQPPGFPRTSWICWLRALGLIDVNVLLRRVSHQQEMKPINIIALREPSAAKGWSCLLHGPGGQFSLSPGGQPGGLGLRFSSTSCCSMALISY